MKSTNTFAAFHFASYLDVSLAWDCWRVNKSRKANRQTKRLTVFDIFAREKETHVGNFLRKLGRCNLTYVGVELELRGGNTLRLADRGDGWSSSVLPKQPQRFSQTPRQAATPMDGSDRTIDTTSNLNKSLGKSNAVTLVTHKRSKQASVIQRRILIHSRNSTAAGYTGEISYKS